MKKINIHNYSIFYSILTLLGMLIWWPCEELAYFMGAGSIMQSLVFIVTRETIFSFFFFLILWIVFVIVTMIAFFRACFKNSYSFLLAIMSADVTISGCFIVYLLLNQTFVGIDSWLLSLGFRFISLLVFLRLFRNWKTTKKTGDGSLS